MEEESSLARGGEKEKDYTGPAEEKRSRALLTAKRKRERGGGGDFAEHRGGMNLLPKRRKKRDHRFKNVEKGVILSRRRSRLMIFEDASGEKGALPRGERGVRIRRRAVKKGKRSTILMVARRKEERKNRSNL